MDREVRAIMVVLSGLVMIAVGVTGLISFILAPDSAFYHTVLIFSYLWSVVNTAVLASAWRLAERDK